MEIKDKNETLQPPSCFILCGVTAAGSFLILKYTNPTINGGLYVINVYLNDVGREVLRTTEYKDPVPLPEPPPIVEPSLWQSFKWNFRELFRSES